VAPTTEETQVSKSHPEQWMIRDAPERPDRSLVSALREFATTQIADCGGPVAVVAPPLRHLAGGAQLCGPAVTVWTKPGDILYVLKAVDLITAGDVLVVDGGGRPDAAVIGDIAGQALAGLGGDGLVVEVADGAVDLVVVQKEHLAPVLAMTKTVADREEAWRQAIAGGARLPAATGIDDLISGLARDRAAGSPRPASR
jgi:4-hydroxy-4-methyl-2-oxoglutarate aldolase